MSNIFKYPVVSAIIIGSVLIVVMNYYNPSKNIINKKQLKKQKSFFKNPKNINICMGVIISLCIGYYIYARTTSNINISIENKSNSSIESITSSEKSYLILGKGLQLPDGQQLPDIFHKFIYS